MTESEQFTAHAERFRAEALETELENVRERCLRAASAWDARAAVSRRTAAARLEREATTAAKTSRD